MGLLLFFLIVAAGHKMQEILLRDLVYKWIINSSASQNLTDKTILLSLDPYRPEPLPTF